jgi:hypothetical protein
VSTRRRFPNGSRDRFPGSFDGRAWAGVALLVAAGYYAVVGAVGYEGLLVGLVVPLSLGVEAYARARHPSWQPLVGAGGRAELLPTVLGLLIGSVATAIVLLSAGL